MRRLRYSVAMSLDGYIASPQGGYDWIVMDPDIDFGALFENFDTRLMGRKSYDEARAQGPMEETAGMKTYVFSHSLRQADCPDVTVSDDLHGTVSELKLQPGKDIWLWGGGSLFRSALDLELVDTVEVAIIPVLLGGGTPFLAPPASTRKLRLTENRVNEKTGTVFLMYSVEG